MSAQVRNLRDAQLFIEDGSPTPKRLVIDIMDGDLSFTEAQPETIIKSRGKIIGRKLGDEEAIQVSFSFKFMQWNHLMAGAGLSPIDVLNGTQDALNAGWVSTDECGPYAINLRYRVADPCNPANYEDLFFTSFFASSKDFKEAGDASVISVKGTCLQSKVSATYVGV